MQGDGFIVTGAAPRHAILQQCRDTISAFSRELIGTQLAMDITSRDVSDATSVALPGLFDFQKPSKVPSVGGAIVSGQFRIVCASAVTVSPPHVLAGEVQPRDLRTIDSVFTASQRASLLVRHCCVVMSMAPVRAVILPGTVLLFHSDSATTLVNTQTNGDTEVTLLPPDLPSFWMVPA